MRSHAGECGAITVRPWRRGDRSAFLDLYEAVWGVRKGPDWFDWRFDANPYVREVPMVVAERDGDVVGAEPCLAFRLRAGRETALAFQPADWMVHPDHRRRGVFTSMTERLLDRYADGPPRLYYNFPSEAIRPGLERFDWQIVGRIPTHYRTQDLSALGVDRLPVPAPALATAAVERGASALARGHLALCDRRAGAETDASVVRHDRVPVETMASLYRRGVPDRVHVCRDDAFYRWRFANPRWSTTAYVARRDGRPIAGLVACTETVRGVRTTAVLDAVPVDGSAPDAAYDALLSAVVADAADADVLKLAGEAVPGSVRRGHGFLSDAALPLSAAATPTRMATRPASSTAAEPRRLGGRRLTDPEQWALGLAGQDVA